MDKSLSVRKSILIQASAESIWQVLTEPKLIKTFLFGTETITDWKVGSKIQFKGKYEDKIYHDKGRVLANKKHRLIQYAYWSQFSGLEDRPENYSEVNYELESKTKQQIEFTWKQIGFSNQEACSHTEKTLGMMLEKIKELAESL